jgi:hypothetical protein
LVVVITDVGITGLTDRARLAVSLHSCHAAKLSTVVAAPATIQGVGTAEIASTSEPATSGLVLSDSMNPSSTDEWVIRPAEAWERRDGATGASSGAVPRISMGCVAVDDI